ncbi:MAG: DEAD/DEAH box helicase [Saprospiraceae bacterium]|nr:DEAD/DEAH box helicase [Saprospiraceae bacterium]
MSKNPFTTILAKYRQDANSERDKGNKFERLMQAYLQTDRQYADKLSNVWLWNEFPAKDHFGGKDTGIDLVARTVMGEYWAIQCKCFQADATIDKPSVDTFLSTSSRQFLSVNKMETVGFSNRLWISTTNNWGPNAEEAIRNQVPPLNRINLHDLEQAPVDWEKLEAGMSGDKARTKKKSPFAHQLTAINRTHEHFKTNDRGKLIMACGTGKTYTALKIAEKETGGRGLVLFLVPSIALLGQTLREWSAEANETINAICICSDAGVSQKRTKFEDSDGFGVVDLALPASTNILNIVTQFRYQQATDKPGMTVVFSTYQSIEVVAKAQAAVIGSASNNSNNSNPSNPSNNHPFGIFDLIICDEAHRTTGVTLSGDDESAFVKVHDNDFLKAKKRLYMTATPRLFNDDTKTRAAQAEAVLCSMDDERVYGEEIYRIGFGEAVEKDLLSDYKVLILTLSEADVPTSVQNMLSDKGKEIKTDDAAKLIGCINALSKQILGDAGVLKETDPEPMRRAVAFCQNIAISQGITGAFNVIKDSYPETLSAEKRESIVSLHSQHIDGAMTAPKRDELMSWLKSTDTEPGDCRVLTNVRCLSEGVDVPSLDAVMFLSARNSQVDVVQSVGRVMRKSPGKKYGYIIIPVVVPSDVSPEAALADNDRYRVVWTVLNALRAHDDRFNAIVNKIELNKKQPEQIVVGRISIGGADGAGDDGAGTNDARTKEAASATAAVRRQLEMQFQELQGVVFARMVEKVGDRRYWEQWAKDVAQIAERHIERIKRLIANEGSHRAAFVEFLSGLQRNINPGITQEEAIEMLAQHLITRPVFDALFEGYSFVKSNPVSVSMQAMLDLLEGQNLDKDAETLQKFYESVRKRAADIDNAEGKQRIIVELYDKFFKTAFPKMVEQLGIVYTPVEVVDFIIRSADWLLKKEFDRHLTDENIHILDPFTGTGTFITRLLQSGLIAEKDLERKYLHELHANEIVLLAYYIAAVNIENAYHDATPDPDDGIGKEKYTPFDGICLTDTFQLSESDNIFSEKFPQNSERAMAQKQAPLRVIIGNPPYSVGQKSANDNAQNQAYPKLDGRIANTYAKETEATLKNSLYDSYIKAFRWSSDRLDKDGGGIIAFVSNGAWIDGNAMNGFRKCIEKEFTSVYIFNLRGNQRTSGELSRKEGGKIFGSGSRTPIAITFLVKNPTAKNEKAQLFYHDIGDYLNREEKLDIVKKFGSVGNVGMNWEILMPDKNGDWLNQRDTAFDTFTGLGDKNEKGNSQTFFVQFYSNGLKTNRDIWCFNSNLNELSERTKNSIDYFNSQVEKLENLRKQTPELLADSVIEWDATKFVWDRQQKKDLANKKKYQFDTTSLRKSSYRPFFKQWVYFNRQLNNCVYKLPTLFPSIEHDNLLICVPAPGGNKDFSVLITNCIPDLHYNGDTQCFPLYYYEEQKQQAPTLFGDGDGEQYVRRDGISDFILARAQKAYGKVVTKEDIFYYVYGFLHHPGYRSRFANDLKKTLPRLPLVDEAKDFWAFSKAGRKLAELHLNYESLPFPAGVLVNGEEIDRVTSSHPVNTPNGYRVEKMRNPKKGEKDTILFNSQITISNIPAEAYEYTVNGKSAIEWVMERYQVTTDKDSGIRNDANDWAAEVGNPRYVLELVLRVIGLSVETVGVVGTLPEVNF